jgi:RimJ/RimL family protein N-acetyltransferase
MPRTQTPSRQATKTKKPVAKKSVAKKIAKKPIAKKSTKKSVAKKSVVKKPVVKKPVKTATPKKAKLNAIDELPFVRLRDVQEADYALLETWMQRPEVLANLDYTTPPDRYAIKRAVLQKNITLLMIDVEDGSTVGFYCVYLKGLIAHNTHEFDVAIPDQRYRQIGISKAAGRAFEDWAFGEQGLSGLRATVLTSNKAGLAMARAFAWPIAAVGGRGQLFKGQLRDVVRFYMTAKILDAVRRERGF